MRAAVDSDLGAGDEGPVVGGHHGDHRCNCGGVSQDTSVRAVQKGSLLGPQPDIVAFRHLVERAQRQGGRNPARLNIDCAQTLLGVFESDRVGKRENRALTGSLGGHVGVSELGGRGGEVNHDTTAAIAQRGQRLPRHQKCAG